jgi:hypothetical protein
MHKTPVGVALYVRTPDLARRLQAAMPDIPVACAASLAELARLLQDVRWRAVAVEVGALEGGADELVGRLAALFPDVPLIALGGAAEERAVAPLIATGCIHRFVRIGTSAVRTRAYFAAALGRSAAPARAGRSRDASPPIRGTTDVRRAVLAGGIASALVALAATAWLLGAGTSPPDGEAAGEAPAQPSAAATRAPPRAARLDAAAGSDGTTPTVAPRGSTAVSSAPASSTPDTDEHGGAGLVLLAAAEDAYARRQLAEAGAKLADAARVLGADAPPVVALRERIAVARARAEGRREAWEAMAREWSRPVQTAGDPPPPTPGG